MNVIGSLFTKITNFKVLVWVILLIWSILSLQPVINSQVLTTEQKKAFQSGVYYFNTELDCPSGSTAVAGSGVGSGKVYMIGDSIAAGTTGELTEAYKAKGFTSSPINAISNRSITEGPDATNGLTVLANDKAQYADAKAIVVELGANGGINTDMITKVMNIIRAGNPNAQVSWVNIGADNSKRKTPLDADNWNITLQENKSLGYSVIDWATQVKQNPDYIVADTVGVHTSAAGKKPFAETVANGATGAPVVSPASSSSANCTCGNSTASTLPGSDNMEKVWNFFAAKSLTPIAIAGVLGNLREESGVEPRRVQYGGTNSRGEKSMVGQPSSLDDNMRIDGSTGYGIAQWTFITRQQKLHALAVQKGTIDGDLNTQLEHLYIDMAGILERLSKTSDVREATLIFHEIEGSGDSTEGKNQRVAAAVDSLTKFGSGTSGAGVPASTGCTTGGSGVVNPDGYSFPLEAQKKIRYDDLPCGQAICHHDDTAALDLSYGSASDMVGKKVYAISDGKAIKISPVDKDPNCMGIQFKSSKDSFYYWYGHVQNVTITVGQEVKAGQHIAEVAQHNPNLNCDSGGPHLHIDRGCVKNGVPQTGGGVKCRDADFVPFMNKMWESLPI